MSFNIIRADITTLETDAIVYIKELILTENFFLK